MKVVYDWVTRRILSGIVQVGLYALPTSEIPGAEVDGLSTIPGMIDATLMGAFDWPMPIDIDISGLSTYSAKLKGRQPYVQVYCKQQWLSETQDANETYLSFINISSEHVNLTWASLIELIENNTATFGVLDLFHGIHPPAEASNHSLLMVEGCLGDKYVPFGENAVASANTCVIDATWAKMELNATLVPSFTVDSSLAPAEQQDGEAQMISLSPEWGRRVATIYNNSSPSFPSSLTGGPSLTGVPSFALALALSYNAPNPVNVSTGGWFETLEQYGGEQAAQQALNMTDVRYTSASAYFQANRYMLSQYKEVYFRTSTPWTDAGSLFHLDVDLFRSGYGYNSASVPVQLSLAVVAVYAFIAIFYLTYIFITGHVASSWNSFGELFLLAVNSSPPRGILKGTNVGVATAGPFREPVHVMANGKGTIELVFMRDSAAKHQVMQRVETNRAY